MGDLFFDLANFSVNHEFDETTSAVLLEAHFGDVRDERLGALRLMRLHVGLPGGDVGRRAAGRSRSSTSTSGPIRGRHFERLERTAASQPFGEALELIA